jgi:hypothetical protein
MQPWALLPRVSALRARLRAGPASCSRIFPWYLSLEVSSVPYLVLQSVVNMTGQTAFSIAVYGFFDSIYSIQVDYNTTVPTLINGQVVTGSVASGAYMYYTYTSTDPHDEVSVVLTRLSGDPDLLVNTNSWPPTMGNATFTSLRHASDIINLPLQYTGVVTIGVYGSGASQFSLVVEQDVSVRLLDGVPAPGSLQRGTSQRFYLLALPSAASITFSLSLTSGAADIYIKAVGNVSLDVWPTPGNSDWNGHADYFTPYSLTIESGQPNFLTTYVAPAVSVRSCTARTLCQPCTLFSLL